MQRQISGMLEHMATSQLEMAKILEAKRQIAVRMAQLIHDIPPTNPAFNGIEALTEHSMSITKNIATYLSSLADFEDALADNLAVVFKQVQIPDEEE
ncbi:nucleoside-diphosphate sugar epimerase [Paenibacillus filicis]|uniref:Nucleoside-diphosphate sugar epimerase n=1 Tax=Paenibacillus gyeongsangnamensis TaxID=3388067 RepID=A0ABT4Q9M8_9BACL|nr:nucleoside-diphosphate sugar epimerase [Paenibacillus filicis]MCZ8513581.1 nucleoside-diphosphate sugar epimerase [Paenibacillus filicis]